MQILDWLTSSSKRRAAERFMVKLINYRDLLERTRDSHREETRTPVSLEVRVTPWNAGELDPTNAFFGPTRDLTPSGLSFISPRLFSPDEKIALSIFADGEYHHVQAEIRHATPLGPETFLVGCSVEAPLSASTALSVH
jgi:hypothetical protein